MPPPSQIPPRFFVPEPNVMTSMEPQSQAQAMSHDQSSNQQATRQHESDNQMFVPSN